MHNEVAKFMAISSFLVYKTDNNGTLQGSCEDYVGYST